MEEIEQVHFHKGMRVWWNLKMAKRKPPWVIRSREDQAAEILDVEGDNAVIGVLNEHRKIENYIVPTSQLRKREIT